MKSTESIPRGDTVATHLAPVLSALFAGHSPINVRAWDGSETGPPGAPVVVLKSREALRQLLWHPGELGLARAYISGELDVEAELAPALSTARQAVSARPLRRAIRPALAALLRTGVVGPPPGRPSEEARLTGRHHTLHRDRAAISHHYDLGNDFYAMILDETMAYSCGYWAGLDPTSDGTDASRAKLDLVCRKLALRPGMRLIDVGCGWGSLVVHAAREYGVHATGYTISREQAAYVRRRIERADLTAHASVAVRDYREIGASDADAVASIEMGEHVGAKWYPVYARALHNLLRPGGRLVVQQMSRPRGSAPGGGPFIEAYIAPDMHMRPLPDTLRLLADTGLEIRHVEALREDYVLTIGAWARRLEQRWADVVALAGERTARIWRLYLAGGSLTFAENRMGVDQTLAVRAREG